MAFLAAWALALAAGFGGRPSASRTVSLFVVVIGMVALFRFVALMVRFIRAGEPRPLQSWSQAMQTALPDWVETIVYAASVCVFLVSLGWLKSMIPLLVPFWADAPLAEMDRAIGVIVPPLPPFVIAYSLWQAAHLLCILWVVHWRDRDLALRTYFLTWSVGMALAFIFSSAGPIFTGDAPSDPMTKLEAGYLWANYKSGGAAIGGGISAFPSMHVAIACWIAFILRLRGVKYIGEVFVVLIYLGAVALRWHYWADVAGGLAVFAFAYAVAKRKWTAPVIELSGPAYIRP